MLRGNGTTTAATTGTAGHGWPGRSTTIITTTTTTTTGIGEVHTEAGRGGRDGAAPGDQRGRSVRARPVGPLSGNAPMSGLASGGRKQPSPRHPQTTWLPPSA